MMDFFSIILPVGILVLCAYGVGYMSGSDAAREIYNPTIRKSKKKGVVIWMLFCCIVMKQD
jgi:hypothetical protein